MREVVLEIWSSIRRNKLRTFLTGFAVAWGIFMLIVLLGAGNGLQNGMKSNFDYMAVNSIEVQSGWTSIPYGGYDKWRYVRLSNEDINIIKDEFSEHVDVIAARGYYQGGNLTYKENFLNVSLLGVTSKYTDIVKIEIVDGRFINEHDIHDRRKVIVLEESSRDILFPDGSSPIGEMVVLKDVIYTIVGVYKAHSFGNQASCFIPLTTGQAIYASSQPWVGAIIFTIKGLNTKAQMKEFEDSLRYRLAAEHNFSPLDKNGVYIDNNFDSFQSMDMVFGGMTLVLWIIGLGTLLAGVVGVSNIMLVTITERTFEFGIRKALGAKPSSIIRLILLESVFITAIFGYLGLIFGVAVMEVVNYFVEQAALTSTDRISMFLNPTLNISTAISATVVLIIAGLISGYVPAKRAAQLKTIDAMRYNK